MVRDRMEEAFSNIPLILECLSNSADMMLAFANIMQASREAGYQDGFSDGVQSVNSQADEDSD